MSDVPSKLTLAKATGLSARGQQRTSVAVGEDVCLWPKADMRTAARNIGFAGRADAEFLPVDGLRLVRANTAIKSGGQGESHGEGRVSGSRGDGLSDGRASEEQGRPRAHRLQPHHRQG